MMNELAELRKRIAELEAAEAECKMTEEALERSELENALILNSLPELVVYEDRSLRIVWANRAAAESVGSSTEQLVGRHCYEVWPQRSEPCEDCPVLKSMSSGQPQQSETTIPDGRSWFIRAHPVRDEKGQVVGAVEITSDVTERKKAEEALQESEERYRAVFNSTGTATVIIEEDTTISAANQEFERLSGYSREEVEGKKSWTELVAPEDLASMQGYQESRQIDPASAPRNYEFRAFDREGTTKHIYSTVAMIPGTNKRVASMLDITERKKAEAEIRKLSDYLGSVIDNANVWLDVLDEKADVVIWNKAAEVISGYPRDKVVGHGKIWEWLYPDKEYRQEITARAAAIIQGESVKDFETLIRTKGGEYRTISWYSRNLIDQKGQPIGSIALGRDVSDRKRAEEEARYQKEYFKALFDSSPEAVTSVDMDRRLRDANPAFEKLFGYAAEDIRGKHVPELVLPKGREKEGRDFIRRVGQGETVAVETVRKAADGREIPVSLLGAPVIVEGKQVGMLGIYRDISERERAEQEARYQRDYFQSLFNGSPEAVGSIDLQRRVMDINPAFEKLFGYTLEDMKGKDILSFILPKERTREGRGISQRVGQGETVAVETVRKAADGREIPVSLLGAPVIVEGRQIGILAIYRDISERKRAEEALKKSRDFSESLVASMQDGFSVLDPDGVHIDVNPALCGMTGFSREEIIGSGPPHPYWPPEEHQTIGNALQETLKGKFRTLELTFMRKNGERFPVLVSPSWTRDKQGNAVSYHATIKDISERKRAQEAVRESEEKLRLMFECVSEGIVVADLNGNIIEANEKVVQLGRSGSKSDLLGRNAVETITSHDRERASADMQRLMETGGTGTREYTLTRADGSQYPAEISASLLKDTSGNPVGFVSVIRDITERQRAAEERLRLEKLESVGTLAGGIAHDFNNLLVGILSNITLARRHLGADSRAADSLMEAERASLQARDLTQRLLTFARGSEPVKKLVSLPDLLQDSAAFALSGSNVKCRFSLPDDLQPVEVDEGQMNQVISNLVINAKEAMPDGGTVDITARNVSIAAGSHLPLTTGKYVEVSVEDHGAGIPRKHLSRIFEPYFTTKERGSGLGLATAYSIVQKHGGHISVESRVGAGASFNIYLPASRKKAPLEKERKEATAEKPAAMGRILVMDDSEIVRGALSRGLPSIGYEVEFAKEGAEAVERYARARKSGRPFDAVILDLTVPGAMGGKEAIQKLREIDPGVKAIVSSGYSTHPVMAYFKHYGFDDVVVKPYGLEELEEVLGGVVTRRGEPQD